MFDLGSGGDGGGRGWIALLAFNDRFGDIGGGPLSSSIALAGFLSLFPLLLVGIAAIGFLASGDADFTDTVIENLSLQGRAAEVVEDAITTAADSARTATIIGLVGLLWAGLGVVGALQNAMNAAWQTKGRGLLDRAVALAWLVGAGTLFLATSALGPALQLTDGTLWPAHRPPRARAHHRPVPVDLPLPRQQQRRLARPPPRRAAGGGRLRDPEGDRLRVRPPRDLVCVGAVRRHRRRVRRPRMVRDLRPADRLRRGPQRGALRGPGRHGDRARSRCRGSMERCRCRRPGAAPSTRRWRRPTSSRPPPALSRPSWRRSPAAT